MGTISVKGATVTPGDYEPSWPRPVPARAEDERRAPEPAEASPPRTEPAGER
jgi:hypothetical protein